MKSNIIELRSRSKPARPVVSTGSLPCQQWGPDLWFSNLPAELDLAKSYCQGCPSRQPCLAGALERAEPAGVWGGEIFDQGRIIKNKRPRGRPRKQTLVETGAQAS
jgi:WhiB family redox-sensing transcriptional regulator